MSATVLVTGVSRYLGGRFARELATTPGIDRVIGVDVVSPTYDLGDAEFVRADIRNPVVARILDQAGVDTVVHLSVSTSASHGIARISQKEINVIGTMQLLAACQATPSVRRLVVKSTGAVYGSAPTDPALFTESMPVRHDAHGGFVKDAIEVEGYVHTVRRRRPDMSIALLRMAHVIGPHVETALTDYLRRPAIPIPFGYDPRLQLLHERDAVKALVLATTGDLDGTVNVAADGIVTLTQAAAIVGRLPVPVLSAGIRFFGARSPRTHLAEVTGEQVDYLLWGRALATTRMRVELGLEPTYTSKSALEDFAAYVDEPLPGVGAVVGLLDTAAGALIGRIAAESEEPPPTISHPVSDRPTPAYVEAEDEFGFEYVVRDGHARPAPTPTTSASPAAVDAVTQAAASPRSETPRRRGRRAKADQPAARSAPIDVRRSPRDDRKRA